MRAIEGSRSVDSIVLDAECDIFISFLLTQSKISDIFIIQRDKYISTIRGLVWTESQRGCQEYGSVFLIHLLSLARISGNWKK